MNAPLHVSFPGRPLPWLLLGCVIACSGCKSQAHIDTPPAVVRTTSVSVDQVGRITLEAKCLAGEQMIGGGYRVPPFTVVTTHFKKEEDQSPQEIFDGTNVFTDDATDADRFQYPLIVEASYPSALDTWTLVVLNPDIDATGYHQGDVLSVEAYCVTGSQLKLRMAIASIPPHATHPPDYDPTTGIIVTDNLDVPMGGVVTAGGFKLEPLVPETQWKTMGYMGPLWGSYPKVDVNNQAVGWSTDYDTYGGHNASVTTYLLYSRARRILIPDGVGPEASFTLGSLVPSPLVAGPVKQELVQQTIGAGPRPGELVADPGYFSSGGGFRTQYYGAAAPYLAAVHGPVRKSAADPYVNGVRVPLGGWSLELFGAYNPSYNTWAFQETETVYALQLLKLPKNIEVEITNPPDNVVLDQEDPANPGFASVTLKGYAIDHDGSAITGNSLVWKIAGAEVGRGPTLDVLLDLDSGPYSEWAQMYLHPIWLEATGKQGDHETAAISVYTRSPVVVQ